MAYHIHNGTKITPHGIMPPPPPPDLEEKKRALEEAKRKAEAAERIFIHEAMDFKFVAATEAEIYAMFDAEPPTPPVWDGYIDLSEVTISADGYIYVNEIRTDEDMYIKADGTFIDWDEEEDFVRLSDLIINSEGFMFVDAVSMDEDNYILTNAGATDSEGYLTD